MKNEIWKPAIYINMDGRKSDFTGLYEVSNFGNIRNVKTNKLLKQQIHYDYCYVQLSNNKQITVCRVHRLVLSSFKPNEWFMGAVCNHKSEVKTENFLENLEWCSSSYNQNYGNCIQKRIEKQSIGVIQDDFILYQSLADAERITGISHSNIAKCCVGKRKTAGGSTWKYKETD